LNQIYRGSKKERERIEGYSFFPSPLSTSELKETRKIKKEGEKGKREANRKSVSS
jgi:hypothetical protein